MFYLLGHPLRNLFLSLFCVGFIFLGFADTTNSSQTDKNSKIKPVNLVKVYYFHTTYRCRTCTLMQQYTEEVIEVDFADAIKAGDVQFEVVNVELKENNDYIKKYNIYTKMVIVSKLTDGKEKEWKNLDKIWDLVKNPEEFKSYIREGIEEYLNS